jgi:alkylation response protein AidB-like acyl-CoA dehydrogenase
MSTNPSERQSREVAEHARETEWKSANFLRDLFLGSFRADLVFPFPDGVSERPSFRDFYDELATFLAERVDPVAIDEAGEYPEDVIEGLAALGAFGMKIPTEYGGLGFTQREYERVMELIGSYDANITALLSAHQSIGVPQPLKLFGTEEQKRKYLPQCARGAISGFALTEPTAGSDPARIATIAEPTADGSAFVLNGRKLWCTNGTLAKLLVVMAKTPRGGISAFVVETSWRGVVVKRRCHFMGLRALANAELEFHDVVVPRENLIGSEGRGLKIALVTLNTGRLTLPAATTGAVKACLEISRKWSNARVQWGQPIGKHEAIAHKLGAMAATAFAMEAVADLASDMADRSGYDIRLEAAAAKEWNTVAAWNIVDDALEIRGGRGYESERSLASRGEVPIGIERMMRDSRVNRIFEGSSEIMHLFMAREAVDKHLEIAGALIAPHERSMAKLAAAARSFRFYAAWFPRLFIGGRGRKRFRAFGPLAFHVRFIERTSRRLARSIFYGMLVFRAGLERRQAFLFRLVDIAMELFVMTAAIGRAHRMYEKHHPAAREALTMADLFCRTSRRVVAERFRALWRNDDVLEYRVGRRVLEGSETWLEDGIVGLRRPASALEPRPFTRPPPSSRPGRTSNLDDDSIRPTSGPT